MRLVRSARDNGMGEEIVRCRLIHHRIEYITP